MEKKKSSLPTILAIVGAVGLVYFVGNVVPEKMEKAQAASKITPVKTPEQIAEDSIQLDNAVITELAFSTEKINSTDWARYTDDLSGPAAGVTQMREWQRIWRRASQRNTPEINAATKKYKALLSKTQASAFPKLRKAYGKHVAAKLWVEDIKVTVSGSKSDLIKFVGGAYAANRIIQANQEALQPVMTMLRFHQSQYRWYDGADEYTYYDMVDRGKDGEVDL